MSGANTDSPPVESRDGFIRISGELTIQHAEVLKPLLLAALPTDGSVARLDLSQVNEIDTSGLQLLMSAQREVVNRGTTLQIVSVSEIVRQALELFRQASLMVAPAGEGARA
jgi:anti-anti-sigma factor